MAPIVLSHNASCSSSWKNPSEKQKTEGGRVVDVWHDMEGWEDPREIHPPIDCLVDLVLEDMSVIPGRFCVKDGIYGFWKTEAKGLLLFGDVLAWSWCLENA